jgi:thiol-disulfide isomerase/thioredoxin
MKTFINTIIMLLYAVSVSAQTALNTDSVYIAGKITNHKNFTDAETVDVIIDNMAFHKQITYRGKINSDGTYRLAFLKTGMQDVMLKYNNQIEVILVSPGDRMQLDFDAENYHSSLVFKGDGAQSNREYRAYQEEFYADATLGYGGNRQNRHDILSAASKDKQPDEFKKFWADRYVKENKFLTAYIKAHHLSPNFAKWVVTDLKYAYLKDVVQYPFKHPSLNGLDINSYTPPADFYDFVTEADLNNLDATLSSSFGDLLYSYSGYLKQKMLGKSYVLNKAIDMYLAEKPGIKKDIMLSQAMFTMIDLGAIEIVKQYLDRYMANTTDPGIRNCIVKAYTDQIDRIENYKIPISSQINNTPKSAADSVFSNIIAKFPGKVVYVDFWATWCGPCRAEMPNSKKLKKELIGKDVVFVYLGVQCEEKLWKAAIAEMDIDGEHFFVDDKGFGAMSEKFRISGIPHYMLVDKQGRVVDDNAKRPGNSQLKEEIEKLMASN